MACRTPVIGTPAGVIPELIRKHDGGVLVAPEDPADMASAIVRFARMGESEWRAFSDRAHASATGYSLEDAVDLFEAALVRTIELEGSAMPVLPAAIGPLRNRAIGENTRSE
jgi:glycosyltransferase involved in cell wall biosynthesis